MQSKIIFFENTFEAGSIDKAKIYHPAKLLHKFRRFIECSDWDESLLKYEKYVNWFPMALLQHRLSSFSLSAYRSWPAKLALSYEGFENDSA